MADIIPTQVLWSLLVFAVVSMIGMSLLAYAAFAHDKRQARIRGRRVPEKTLLWLALWGGWPGAKFAQRGIRHKTQKEPFRTILNAIGVLQVIGITVLLFLPGQHWGKDLDALVKAAMGDGLAGLMLSQVRDAPGEGRTPHRFGPGSADW